MKHPKEDREMRVKLDGREYFAAISRIPNPDGDRAPWGIFLRLDGCCGYFRSDFGAFPSVDAALERIGKAVRA